MKRLFFSMVMLFAASITFAQVKSVKEAKSIAQERKIKEKEGESSKRIGFIFCHGWLFQLLE